MNFSFELLEVMDQSTHKYSSTSVSGTRGNVSSSTEHHVDQEIWTRNPISGKERVLNLSSRTEKLGINNVDTRPGHRLVTVRSPSDTLVRLHSESLGISYGGDGRFNPWLAPTQADVVKTSIVAMIMSLVPLFGPLILALLLVGGVFKGTCSNRCGFNAGASASLFAALVLGVAWTYSLASGATDSSGDNLLPALWLKTLVSTLKCNTLDRIGCRHGKTVSASECRGARGDPCRAQERIVAARDRSQLGSERVDGLARTGA